MIISTSSSTVSAKGFILYLNKNFKIIHNLFSHHKLFGFERCLNNLENLTKFWIGMILDWQNYSYIHYTFLNTLLVYLIFSMYIYTNGTYV